MFSKSIFATQPTGLARVGKEILLIEQNLLGGEHTHTACIPSKTLIASAKAAHHLHEAHSFGLRYQLNHFNAEGAMHRIGQVVHRIADQEDALSLTHQGVHVLRARATFINAHTLSCILPTGEVRNVTAQFIVIATGSHPHIPSIENIEKSGYLTNETIFSLKTIPHHLGILGMGPVGIELGLAFQRLGSKVTIIGRSDTLLRKEDPEVREMIQRLLEKEGIQFLFQEECTKIQSSEKGKHLFFKNYSPLIVDEVLIATGRRLNTNHLGLQHAGIYYNENRIKIDRFGRTTQKNIFAVGDITGHGFFTHVAEHQGRGVLKTLLFWPLKFSIDQKQLVPRVTFTDPEIASIGLHEHEAVLHYGKGKIATYSIPLRHVDRAFTEGEEEGFIKIVTKRYSSRILGASIVAKRAGEMLMPLSLAIHQRIPLRKFSSLIHPYPIFSQAIRKAADHYYTHTLFALFKKS